MRQSVPKNRLTVMENNGLTIEVEIKANLAALICTIDANSVVNAINANLDKLDVTQEPDGLECAPKKLGGTTNVSFPLRKICDGKNVGGKR